MNWCSDHQQAFSNACTECRDERLMQEEARAEQYAEFMETTNEFGFPQMMQHDRNGRYFPVCCACHACVMPNQGQGQLCDSCAYDAEVECEHNYNDGLI